MLEEKLTQLDWIAGKTHICFTSTDPALLAVDAIVEEQDTAMVLGPAPVLKYSVESFPALVNRMETQQQQLPGDVIVKKTTSPKRFIAVVYDIDQTPICQWEWVELALQTVFEQCEQLRIATLAMPLPGHLYGKLDAEASMGELQKILRERRSAYPKKILIYKI